MNNKNNVRLGDGVADDLKKTVNNELSEIGKLFVGVASEWIKEKVHGINIDELFTKNNQEELLDLWSTKLSEAGLVSKAYAGLSDNLLIDNLHQEGYLSGVYIGYLLAMMSLVDNDASKELILLVRDDIRKNLLGPHYNKRSQFIEAFESEKYNWVNSLNKDETIEG